MTSSPADPADPGDSGDGLLSPVVAGTPIGPLTDDRALLVGMLTAEAALAGALADVGIVTVSAADAVAEVCTKWEADREYLARLARRATAGGNPVIPLVADLRERVGSADPDAVAAVHHGATSQDILDTALMLLCRRALERLATDLRVAAGDAARLADEHRDTLACGRTLTQQAMPTTFGFRCAGWLAGLTDALSGVESVSAALPMQFGGPVGTAAGYAGQGPAVADAMAARLGLSPPVLSWHTRRTPVAGVGHALVVATGAVGKVAADVLAMSQTEVGEVAEASGGSSSSMAHKANPAQSVLVAAAARQVPALVSVLGTSMVAEQERPPGAWHAEWEPLRQALRLSGAGAYRTAALLSDLRVDADAMRRNLDHLVRTAGIAADVVDDTPSVVAPWIDRALAGFERTKG